MHLSSVPHNPEAEESVIGCCLLSQEALQLASETLQPSDFYSVRAGMAYKAAVDLWREGKPTDVQSTADRMVVNGWDGQEMAWLLQVQADTPALSSIRHYVEIVQRDASKRRIMALGLEMAESMGQPTTDPGEYLDSLQARIKDLDVGGALTEPDDITFEDLRSRPQQEQAPWVVQGIIRQGWRILIVGREGDGKSMLLTHVAVCASYGVHPFTHRPYAPARVLLIDLENPEDEIQNRVDTVALQCEAAGFSGSEGRLWHRLGGIDLRKRVDRLELENVVRTRRPELVAFGPMYAAYRRSGRESDEQVAMEVISVLNDLRQRYGFALMMETHAPHGEGATYRALRPIGSSAWLRWPEIGISLVPQRWGEKPCQELRVERFRGDRVTNRWPDTIRWGNKWLWEGHWEGDTPTPPGYRVWEERATPPYVRDWAA